MSAKFCPFCQRKNKSEAVRCVHCGVLLIAHKPGAFTTVGIESGQDQPGAAISSCADLLREAAEGAMVLFIMEEEEPIVFQDARMIVIGRDIAGDLSGQILDLAKFGELALGISRQHAQISFVDGRYWLEDLGSTNGTWLNRRRLERGKTYPLRSDDQIWLGPLKMLVCFRTAERLRQPVKLRLKERGIPVSEAPRLTAHYLATHLTPYLEAIADLERARCAMSGDTAEDVAVGELFEQEAAIVVTLKGGRTTVQWIRKWIPLWRDKHLTVAAGEEDKVAPELDLMPLALDMLADLAPDISAENRATFLEAIMPALHVLATSSLELS